MFWWIWSDEYHTYNFKHAPEYGMKFGQPAWKQVGQARVTVLINDNNCAPQRGLMTMARSTETLNVNCSVANHVTFVPTQPQKKGPSPITVKQRKN